jgi:23S rRNA pseudouridine2605 synthase
MCEAVGHPVLALRRVAFGPLALGDLPAGGHRRLTAAEVERLRAAGPKRPTRPARSAR